MPVSLPVLTLPLRLTPTDVSQFVRLEQCERFLRLKLAERARQRFLYEYDVAPQRLTPLLSLSGRKFEDAVEADLRGRFRSVHYAARHGQAHDRPTDAAEVAAEAAGLPPGQTVLLFQPRLEADLDGWHFRGDVDLIRLDRAADGVLHVLVGDMKSTTEAKVEHRLQVAFYRLMLEALFAGRGIAHAPVRTGILFRPPADPTAEEEAEIAPLRRAAKHVFGLDGSLLEIVADGDAYVRSARDLVLGPESVARQVAAAPFERVPFGLSFKCDGCLYNEFCMKWTAEADDLSLLPYLAGTEKEALRRAGITAVKDLAALKDFAPSPDGKGTDLIPAPGREALVKQIAATWPVGPRLDELVHRARSFRGGVRKDGTRSLPFIPGKGNSTLPVSTADLNANLVTIHLDAQHDYLEGRVYLLGGLVVARKKGEVVGRRAVVRLTDGRPDTAAKERTLFQTWTRDLLAAVVELAHGDVTPEGKKAAPIHVVFFDRHEQRLMLESLARNFPPILEATPPLYDFLTQVAAFDSPIATYLTDELRDFQNLPMVCQTLHSVATFKKFDWKTPHDFREAFKARLFDNAGKMEIDGQSEWYTRRGRFASAVPLEYAYAAWGELPKPAEGKGDEFADYRGTTLDLLTAFAVRRLEAVEHVAGTIRGNPNTAKTPFVLPDLATFEDKASDLAHALHEFVTIERLVALDGWKATRHAPAERRVLMGDCLLVRYVEEDQPPEVAEQNRENARRQRKRDAIKAATPPGKRAKYPEDCQWSAEGLKLRLRIETTGVDCDLTEALAMSALRAGDRLVLYPRSSVDGRLPEAERKEFPSTPKQMLYGQRAVLAAVETVKDAAGRVVEAFAEVELRSSWGNKHTAPYVFLAVDRPLEAGTLYTLDPCPDEWYAYSCLKVVEGLCDGRPNALYDRLAALPPAGDGAGSAGQAAFLAGLDAFTAAGRLHDFEASKREFIGRHARTPVLLVQGPPGTGKSYCTAFAVFARLQGAMAERRPCRAFLSCKTHAATDVLLANVLDVQVKLRELRAADAALFDRHFDPRLLDVPLYRLEGRDPPPAGVIALPKEDEREKGDPFNADTIREGEWAVVAAAPGGIHKMLKAKWPKNAFGRDLCDLLVLDEASQMNLPEAVMAALPLAANAPVVVVGDHRQMPPIVKHDWEAEARRTFRQFQAYESLFDALRAKHPPIVRFAESFRLHAAMAEFLREEVYRHDGIPYHSRKRDGLPAHPTADDLTAAVLHPDYPLVVVVHDEAGCQTRNPFEQALIDPILRVLADKAAHGLDAAEGLGVVVPHRAQRAALQLAFPDLCVIDAATGKPARSAIDTVERFQGGERMVILVSATESDRAYLLASSKFLLDPRRLTVALSRAKRKMVLVASRGIFSLFSPDAETFANALLWKNLLGRACPTRLWEGERGGQRVAVWGGRAEG